MAFMTRPGSWSLKTKLALSSGVLLFVFSVASTSWVLHNVEKDVRASVIEAQASLVRSTAADLEEKVALRRDAIATIAPLLSVAAPTSSEAMAAFFEPRPVLKKLFDDVMVADASGKVIHVGAADAPHDDDAIGDRAYFKQVLAGASFVVSSPMRSKSTGNPFIAFAAPLRSPDGAVTGVLVGSLNLTRPNVISALGNRRIGEGGYFALITMDDAGTPVFLMHRYADRIMTPTMHGSADPLAERALRGEEFNQTSLNFQGIETLRSYIRVKGVPWVLVALYPTSQAFAELENRRAEALWIGAALFTVACLLAWTMSNWLLRPLGRLRAVLELHASDPMLPIAATDMGSSELAALVKAYNAQAASRHAAQSRLEASERHMKDITDNLPVLISYVDKNERCVFFNRTFCDWFGIDPTAAIGQEIRQIVGEQRYASLAGAVRRCIAGARVSFELRVDTLQGAKVLDNVYLPDRGPGGDIVGFYALSSDVTQLKEVQSRLDALVRTDALTGVANRYHFDRVLPLAIARCLAAGSGIALLFLDIDHFKSINDTHGHAAGDETLKEVARRLRDSVRTTDTVARLGGDEFVVILEGPQSEMQIKLIAGKIVEAIAKPFRIDGQPMSFTTSVGVAFSANAEVSAREALAVADAALYRAKTTGRGRFCFDLIASSETIVGVDSTA